MSIHQIQNEHVKLTLSYTLHSTFSLGPVVVRSTEDREVLRSNPTLA